jgi:NADH:ubiquinone oxidoreductase subunit C
MGGLWVPDLTGVFHGHEGLGSATMPEGWTEAPFRAL